MKIKAIRTSDVDSYGISYACQSILEGMLVADKTLGVKFFSVTASSEVMGNINKPLLNPSFKKIGHKLLSPKALRMLTEYYYLSKLKKDDITYIWPKNSIDFYERLHHKGNLVVKECINTNLITAKKILDSEYARLDIVQQNIITQEQINAEKIELNYTDFFFSPSLEVTKSLIRAGIEEEKILSTSYGLREKELYKQDSATRRGDVSEDFTAIFVGRIGVRKGVHLLLDYWAKSGIKGKLKLVGRVEPNLTQLVSSYLKRDDIEHVHFVKDLHSIFSQADVFILPSLEEGSPLVTYLALGAGLPCLVSPMGSGGIIQNAVEGLVIEPHDEEKWVESLQKIVSDGALRSRMAKNSHDSASQYLWKNVGLQRYELLKSKLI